MKIFYREKFCSFFALFLLHFFPHKKDSSLWTFLLIRERERERETTLCVLKYKWCDERENNTRCATLDAFFFSLFCCSPSLVDARVRALFL